MKCEEQPKDPNSYIQYTFKSLISNSRRNQVSWIIYSHLKPSGAFLPQTLRSKVRATGTFRSFPNTLALMAVHRQTAASRSARPLMRVQHGLVGGEPTSTEIKPSKLAHTPSFKVSLGQVALASGAGFGAGLPQVPQPLTMAKKSTLSARKKTSEALVFEAISK
ncbi:hypothetical protein Hanom_Chr17g01556251 [Helianthus anomalus]